MGEVKGVKNRGKTARIKSARDGTERIDVRVRNGKGSGILPPPVFAQGEILHAGASTSRAQRIHPWLPSCCKLALRIMGWD